MAFAQGNSSNVSIKKYIGIGNVKVVAINPNKKQLEEIFKTTLEKEPEYVGKKEVNGVEVPSVRIDFVVKTDPNLNNGIESVHRLQYFLTKAPMYNNNKDKIKMINKYGECAWIPVEEAKAKQVPANQKWFSPEGMRPALRGEEELIGCLKEFLGIPRRTFKDKNTGETKEIEDIKKAEAYLEKIDNLFSGNVSELRSAISMRPENTIQVLIGVRTSEDNRQYQDVFNSKVLRGGSKRYEILEKALNERKMNGGYPNTEFVIGELREYSNTPTNFEADENNEKGSPMEIPDFSQDLNNPESWFPTNNE